MIELPEQDPNSEYFEILSPEQFHQLQYGNLIKTAKFSVCISLLVGRVFKTLGSTQIALEGC